MPMTTTSTDNSAAVPGNPAAEYTTERPTIAGSVPPALTGRMQPGAMPAAETMRLPRPGERDPIAGLARSTLLELDDSLPPAKRFIIRLRRRGFQRGCTLIVIDRLRAVLAAEIEQQLGAGNSDTSA